MPENITDLKKAKDLGTPDIPASAKSFAIYGSTRISAPAALVFRTLRNTETWRDWNKFVPRVTILHQPPEDDEITAAEIAELIRNTTLAGSVDSDITDGAASQGGGLIGRRMSTEEEAGVRLSPPPVTRERLRSGASGMSGASANASRRASVVSESGRAARKSGEAPTHVPETNGNTNTNTNAASPPLSGAQKFQASQEAHRQSAASGGDTDDKLLPTFNNVLVEAPHDPNMLMPAPPTAASEHASKQQKRRSGAVSAATKRKLSINALYGEPSVRIQLGTRMTFHCRMKLPYAQLPDRETNIVVNEVARPDDTDEDPPLLRTHTHTQSRAAVYRIVWSMEASYAPPKAYPRFLLQAQRVHEIRPVKRGDGREECVYENWECFRGVLAGQTKKRYGKYLQERAEAWGVGLGEYCEGMGGAVERRDFVSAAGV